MSRTASKPGNWHVVMAPGFGATRDAMAVRKGDVVAVVTEPLTGAMMLVRLGAMLAAVRQRPR